MSPQVSTLVEPGRFVEEYDSTGPRRRVYGLSHTISALSTGSSGEMCTYILTGRLEKGPKARSREGPDCRIDIDLWNRIKDGDFWGSRRGRDGPGERIRVQWTE